MAGDAARAVPWVAEVEAQRGRLPWSHEVVRLAGGPGCEASGALGLTFELAPPLG